MTPTKHVQRRRQRSDRRTTGRMLAGVAGGGAVIVALGGLGAAATPTPSPTSTGEPTPITIPDEAYLTVDDIEDDEGQTWSPAGTDGLPLQDCFSTEGWDSDAVGWRHFTDDATEAGVLHTIFREPGGPPEVLFDHIVDAVSECVPHSGYSGVPKPWLLPFWFYRGSITGAGDDMWTTGHVEENPDDPENPKVVHMSVMRHQDSVSIVEQTTAGYEYPEQFGFATALNAADRACTAIYGETCVSDPSDPAGPDPIVIPRDAYLTADDIEDDEGEEWTAVGTVDWPIQECMTEEGWDADAVGWRHYYNEATGSHAYHSILRYPGGPPESLIDYVTDQVEDCVPEPGLPDAPDQELPYWFYRGDVTGVGDLMWASAYAEENPDEPGTSRVVAISAMGYRDTASIVVQTMDSDEFADQFGFATALNAADRACTAIYGETCVTGPSDPPPAEPPGEEPPGDDDQGGDDDQRLPNTGR